MKATGIVRRIDDLGRVVIPKEIRRTMRIREGDPLEIYTSNDGEVVFKKYSPVGEISVYSSMYAEVLNKNAGLPVIICDKDHVVSVAGMPKKEILERRISPMLEDSMQNRRPLVCTDSTRESIRPIEGIDRYAIASGLIVVASDVVGSIVFLSGDESTVANDWLVKLVTVASGLLARQLEG